MERQKDLKNNNNNHNNNKIVDKFLLSTTTHQVEQAVLSDPHCLKNGQIFLDNC